MELSKEQQLIVDEASYWYRNNLSVLSADELIIVGHAGTGKSTIIPYIIKDIRKYKKGVRVGVAALTGKAVSVIKKKISEVINSSWDSISTIHGLMYIPEYKIDSKGRKVLSKWVRKREIDVDLIIIDEGSMINQVLWNDLRSYNVPIIIIGDHGQLPPIGGNFNLMNRPNFTLTEIHRQSLGNPIINLSTKIRQTGQLLVPHPSQNQQVFGLDWRDPVCQAIFNQKINWNDKGIICLCGYNSSRVKLNTKIRSLLQYTLKEPYPDERIMCLKNNYNSGIMNGQLSSVVWTLPYERDLLNLTIQIDGDDDFYECIAHDGCFGKEKYDDVFGIQFHKVYKRQIEESNCDSIDLFDFGYATTVHKSQGSEWDKVVLFVQRNKYQEDDQWRRWLYTAVTRAKEKLFVIFNYY